MLRLVRDLYDQHTCLPIVFVQVQLKVIHRMIQNRVAGTYWFKNQKNIKDKTKIVTKYLNILNTRSLGRHKHKGRRTSDNESELSRGSGRSNRSHNSHRKHRRQRSKHRRGESGSDNESNIRSRSYSGHRKSTGSTELLEPNLQWRDGHRNRNTDFMSNSTISTIQQSGKHQTDPDSSHSGSHHRSRRHKKNRFVHFLFTILCANETMYN